MSSEHLFGGPFAAGRADGDEASARRTGDEPLVVDPSPGRLIDSSLAVEAPSGRRIPFDPARLAASVERARVAGGGTDRQDLAQEVADVVRMTLRARAGADGGRLIGPERLGELVERVLVELGAVDTARSYIVTRDRRSRSEAARSDAGEQESAGLPLVRGASGPTPFRARRIVGALVEEAGLLPDEAERVAERVVETLRSSSLRSVGTGLVRELVSNELLSLGLEDALRRHEAIGVPRHDLVRAFEATRADVPAAALARPWRCDGAHGFERAVSGAILERWALEDEISAPFADAHLTADLHLIGIDAPHRALLRSVPASLLLERGAAEAGSGDALPSRLAAVAAGTEVGLIVEGLEAHVDQPGGAPALLRGVAAAAAGAGVPVDLALTAVQADAGACAALLAALAEPRLRALEGAPRVFADLGTLRSILRELPVQEAEAAADRAETLLRDGALVPAWCDVDGARWAGPGLVRRADGAPASLALDGAVALNLPRIARRAGPWREEEFLGRLHGLVETALGALAERVAFLGRCRRTQGEILCDRPAGALVPVGLYEALRILGDGLARAELGARVLGFLSDAAARGGAEHGIDVRTTFALGGGAAIRFASSDAALGGTRQPRLFGDLPLPEEDHGAPYRLGAGDLAGADGRVGARAEALAGLLRATSAGELIASPEDLAGRGQRAARPRAAQRTADTGPSSGQDSAVDGRDLLLASLLADRPGMAAWSRFETLRQFRDGRPSEGPETTLF